MTQAPFGCHCLPPKDGAGIHSSIVYEMMYYGIAAGMCGATVGTNGL